MNVVYSAPAEYDLKGIPNHEPGNPTNQILFRSTSFTNPYWWAEHNEYLQHTNRAFWQYLFGVPTGFGLGRELLTQD